MAKICLLLPGHWDSAKGGAEFQAHNFADYIARNTNHEVTYLTKRPPSLGGYRYQVRRIVGRGVQQRWGMFWHAGSVYHGLAEISPDVIIQRVACAYTGVAAFYCRERNCKLIWHVSSDSDVSPTPHVPVGRLAGLIDRAIFSYGVRHANAIVAQTREQAQALEANHRRSATAVVPNFAVIPERTWKKSGRFTVLWIANLKQLKQPEVFIKLARELVEEDIAFKMIGRRDDGAWGNSIFEEIDRVRNLVYLGELDVEDVNAELERAHLLVNTSLYEGLPNTFIQAWMREVPTVTLNVDPDGMISESHLGFRASDYNNLKERVMQYFGDREVLRTHGLGARRFAIERFSMANAQLLLNVVENVLRR
jgi:glycosyltransferase involved in cell wall biosynthesis